MADIKNNEEITFDKVQISLASPETIRSWSKGEVTKAETINYRTLKPEKDGLFCEKIFGPSKDWECHCGKYKKVRYKGTICDRCGVEVTKAIVRRERMGSIELASPVSHIWYFKGTPCRIGFILDIGQKDLDRVLYYAKYIVLEPGDTPLEYKQVLSAREYQDAREEFGDAFVAEMGAEAIKKLLEEVDVDYEANKIREEVETATGQKKAKLLKRLEVFEAFRHSGNKPEWMILDVIPVIPPDLRPMVQLDGGRFATSDLNDLYRRVINRNNRLKKLLEQRAPGMILRSEKRMLQEAVDSLFDNGRRNRAVTGAGNRQLKSLSELLKGKQGRFRQNLLGKRVDYSGRSVIVVGPELKIYQCGLPKEMAIELFKPFVERELVELGEAPNEKNARKTVERRSNEKIWDILEDVIKEHPVMLNRAPTLHRLGIQAFEPILVEGKAIKLHPLVCAAFNADFDGDQMAVHVPLTEEAQAECRFLLLSPNNLLKPSDGNPVAVPSQDMVLGIYYLTMSKPVDYTGTDKEANVAPDAKVYSSADEVRADLDKGVLKTDDYIKFNHTHLRDGVEVEQIIICQPINVFGRSFSSPNQAILAYNNKKITLHEHINVKRTVTTPEGKEVSGVVNTTVGRIIFNEAIPQDLGLIERNTDEDYLQYEINTRLEKKPLAPMIKKIIEKYGATKAAEVLDAIKSLGYKYSTIAALTVSVADMTIPASKKEMIAHADALVNKAQEQYERGFMTDEERYKAVIDIWNSTDDNLKKALLEGLDRFNNIRIMWKSGARGSDDQIKQLAGMRGLMADTTGQSIELPVKSSFREGLDVLEYFISSHGARKGLSDTALRTADSGYLTRRLVDVAQSLIVRETDCSVGKEIPFIEVTELKNDEGKVIENLESRITGRTSVESLYDKDGNMIVKANHVIYPERAKKIVNAGFTSVKIRTVLTCKSKTGICAKCYGTNLATGKTVQVGEAVGIIAAQSIGEPGTQLTMRTFHTGGVAGDDITQGLPRVQELFEARKPKGVSIVTEISGTAKVREIAEKTYEVTVRNEEEDDVRVYQIPYGSTLVSKLQAQSDNIQVEAGEKLTNGNVNPHDILDILGVDAVQDYVLSEVIRVYKAQDVGINDKHLEIIIRQMLRKITVDTPGDSDLVPGTTMEVIEFNEINEKLEAEGKTPATGTRLLLGITKASIATDSFLSAASFQETTRNLTDAAVKGKVDNLTGIKENVLLGKLIPAGTGMKVYNKVKLDSDYIVEDETAENTENVEAAVEAVDTELAEVSEEVTIEEAVEEEIEVIEAIDADTTETE